MSLANMPRAGVPYLRIDVAIYANKNLTVLDWLVFYMIERLDDYNIGCIFSASYFANTLSYFSPHIVDASVDNIKKSIQNLIDNNYIYRDTLKSGKETLRLNLKYPVIYEDIGDEFHRREEAAAELESRRQQFTTFV